MLVWDAVIEDGEHETVTEVMVRDVEAAATLRDPDWVVSCVEIAAMAAVPVPLDANTPAELTVPIYGGLADQFTALSLPVPEKAPEHWMVCPN